METRKYSTHGTQCCRELKSRDCLISIAVKLYLFNQAITCYDWVRTYLTSNNVYLSCIQVTRFPSSLLFLFRFLQGSASPVCVLYVCYKMQTCLSRYIFAKQIIIWRLYAQSYQLFLYLVVRIINQTWESLQISSRLDMALFCETVVDLPNLLIPKGVRKAAQNAHRYLLLIDI